MIGITSRAPDPNSQQLEARASIRKMFMEQIQTASMRRTVRSPTEHVADGASYA